MELLVYFGIFFIGPALAVGGIASAVAHWVGKRRGETREEIGRRIRKAFWISFLIAAALMAIAFGLCVAALDGSIG